MATNHTTNYQLNLWEPEDSFLREEFNENSQKIDGALAGLSKRSVLEELKCLTTTQAAAQIDFDCSGVDWGAWQYVLMDITAEAASEAAVYCNLDGALSGGYTVPCSLNHYNGLTAVSCRAALRDRLTCFPLRNPDQKVTTLGLYHGGFCFGSSALNYRQLTMLSVKCSNPSASIASGAVLTLWGIR